MKGNSCDKVSQALNTLKSELMSIREQDVNLMKQLLKINDTIKVLKPKTSGQESNIKASSRRQHYRNRYGNKMGSYGSTCSNSSLCSIEESTSDAEFDDMSGSEENLPQCVSVSGPVKSSITRYHSDEHLLISNIKVWKYKQSRSYEELQKVNSLSVS